MNLEAILRDYQQGDLTEAAAADQIVRQGRQAGMSTNDCLERLGAAAAAVDLQPDALGRLEAALAASSDENEPTRVGPTTPTADDATAITRSEPDADAATQITRPEPADDATVMTRPGGGGADDAATQITAADAGSGSAPASRPGIGVGSVIKERFVLEAMLGKGGMGAVYRARDLRREEAGDREVHVAVKLLNDDFQRHPDAAVSLQREAKKAQTLAHPNIVTVYDFDRDGATLFLSMAYLQGQPLDALIRSNPSGLSIEQATDIVEQMARGLTYAHEKGFAHADFKPGNVFLSSNGNVRILDFGIARAAAEVGKNEAADAENGGSGEQTRFDPTTLGAITPAYASAEMLEGTAPEAADDVFALACTAYELFTGRHPFLHDGRKLPANEAEKINLRPGPLKNVPRRYQKAVARGLAFRRGQRFTHAGEFLEAIQPPSRVKRVLGGVAVVLALVAAGGLYMSYEQSDLAVTLEGLSADLSESKTLIREGDEFLQAGDVEQAHKAYAQAWDSGRLSPNVAERERSRLKVVVDRRVNAVIQRFLDEAEQPGTDSFGLEVLRMSLESLRDSDLGTLDPQIGDTLTEIDRRLAEES